MAQVLHINHSYDLFFRSTQSAQSSRRRVRIRFLENATLTLVSAYTYYSFFEWALIIFDVLYDSAAELDLRAADLKVKFFIQSEIEDC